MKKLSYTIILILLGTSILLAQNNFHNNHYLDPYNPEYVKGEVLIKFKDETQINKSLKSGIAKTGITSVDVLLEPYQIETIDKVFKETREQRQRKTVRTIRDFKGKEIEVPVLFNIYKLKFDTIWDAKQIIEELQKDKNVEYAEPNYLVYTMEVLDGAELELSEETKKTTPSPKPTPNPTDPPNRNTTPNDPLYSQQWYLPAINAPAAWDSTTGDTSQVIAIIDTGVDWDHPDLDDNIWINWDEIPDNGIDDDGNGYIDDRRGWDFVLNNNDPSDNNSHGTHVSGIAGAETNNSIGISGVSWHSKIMPIRVLNSSGIGTSSTVAQGVNYAFSNESKILNLSLGSYAQSGTLSNAIISAYAGNCITVAAAGNDSKNIDETLNPEVEWGPLYPAAYIYVLGVQATGIGGSLTMYSNYDTSGYFNSIETNYELRAPGTSILSTLPNGNYGYYSGTSMATPIVSGSLALLKTYFPTETPQQLWLRLIYSQSGTLDIDSAFNYQMPGSELNYISNELYDLEGDNDGNADVGEEIDLRILIHNVGGVADSAWVKLVFDQFEDTTKATIIKDSAWVGSVGITSTMYSQDSIKILINDSVANGDNISFKLKLYNGSSFNSQSDISIIVEHGTELYGIVDSTIYLTADKLWIINDAFRLDGSSARMVILPGTTVISDHQIVKLNGAKIVAYGTYDSMINIYNAPHTDFDTLNFTNYTYDATSSIINYAEGSVFTGEWIHYDGAGIYTAKNCTINASGSGDIDIKGNAENCIIKMNSYIDLYADTMTNCIVYGYGTSPVYTTNLYGKIIANYSTFVNCLAVHESSEVVANYCNFIDVTKLLYNYLGVGNNIIGGENSIRAPYGIQLYFQNQFWGTSNTNVIDQMIYDFYDNSNLGILNYLPIDSMPSDSAPGIIYKILVNGVNPQDDLLDPLGAGTHRFDVYFNKPMDTSYLPLISFGPQSPYLQNIVNDSMIWSDDSTTLTAFEYFDLNLSDGINRIRVSNAVDSSGMECPVEQYRYDIVLQVAGSASIEFIAYPGIGKVNLEWPQSELEDALGFNLYRSLKLSDSTWSNFQLINSSLIIDTTYTDYIIIPDSTYKYYYTVISTDFSESDNSKSVIATPFDAANGDANGDLSIDVLDITTIVSYMLNQNPTPFLFDAADVNYDGQINVLDIIGVVQLISGDKSAPLSGFIGVSDKPAYYNIENNKLIIESQGNLVGIQFKLTANSQQPTALNRIDKLKIFSKLKGFEFAYGVVDDHIIGILFSLTGKEIPAGTTELFRFEGVDISEIEITEIFGGDLTGDYVSVFKKGQQVNLQTPDDYDLKVQPNPFTQSTVISWQLAEEARVNISIYNLKGIKIANIINKTQKAGSYNVSWTPNQSSDFETQNLKLETGIYICHFEAKTENKTITQDVKIILIN